MKTLTLYYTHKPGGFCKRLYRLLNALASKGHQVFYLTLDTPPSDLSSNVFVVKIPFPIKARAGCLFWFLFFSWAPIFALWKTLSIKPDRFVVFDPLYSILLAPSKLFTRKNLVLFVRGLGHKSGGIVGRYPFLRRLMRNLELFGIRMADKVVFTTKSMQDEIEQYGIKGIDKFFNLPNDAPKIEEHPNAREYVRSILPEELKQTLLEDTIVAVSTGVINQGKNLHFLIDVFSDLGNLIPTNKLFLIIAGDGPLLNSLREYVLNKNIKNVCLLGWCNDVPKFLQGASLYIHPSLHEGMPNALLEALGAGLPVIASDIPEHRELLAYDELLFQLPDPESLLQKLTSLIENKKKMVPIKNFSEKRREVFSFDWDSEAVKIVLESNY